MTISIQNVDVFTQQMNAAFIKGYDDVGETPDISRALTVLPSKGRTENLPWVSPPPMMHQWHGHRQYASLSETNYRIQNLTYTQEFKILSEDLDDDQVGGFKLKFAAMGRMANEWRYIASMKNLALGQTNTAFDGRPFFSSRTDGTSGAIGTGNNLFTATTAASDTTHAMVVLVLTNKMVKPMLWLDRQAPDVQNDMGTKEALKVREVKFWADTRGAPGFGMWSDAVLCKYTGTPTVAEVQTALGTANARLRGFKYPKAIATDSDMYYHNSTKFTQANVLVVCSTLIEHIVRQALTLSLISATENYFKGWADLEVSGYLDGVV